MVLSVVPTGKVITGLRHIGRQRSAFTEGVTLYIAFIDRTAICVERYDVGLGCTGEGRGVGCIAGYCCQLCIPTCEGVGVLRISLFGRLSRSGNRCTVTQVAGLNRFSFNHELDFKYLTVVVNLHNGATVSCDYALCKDFGIETLVVLGHCGCLCICSSGLILGFYFGIFIVSDVLLQVLYCIVRVTCGSPVCSKGLITGCISSNSRHLVLTVVPTGKVITCLRHVGRQRSTFTEGVTLHIAFIDRTAICIECYDVGLGCTGEGCGVGCIAGYGYYLCIPTIEGVGVLRISFLGRSLAIVSRRLTVSNITALEYCLAVLKGDGVLVNRAAELSLVGCITCYLCQCRCPTGEGVRVLCRSGFLRISVRRNNAILNLSCSDDTLVVIEPSDGVATFVRREGCGVGSITGYSCKLCIPARELIRVFFRCLFGRSSTCIFRRLTVSNITALEYCLAVLKGNGVLVNRAAELSLVSCYTRYGCHLRIPTCEGVRVLCRSGFLRISVARCLTVFHNSLINKLICIVKPCNGVSVAYAVELSGISRSLRYLSNSRLPTLEGVCPFSRCLFGGFCTFVSRRLTVSNRCALQHFFTILEGDGVLVHHAVELSLVGCYTCYLSQCRCPTGEGVRVLCRSGFLCICMRRCLTVFHNSLINELICIVKPCDGVSVAYAVELCGINRSLRYLSNSRIPSLERVGPFSRGSLGGISLSIVCRCCTILNLAALQYFFTVHKLNGVLIHCAVELSLVGCSTSYCYDLRIPAGEAIGILSRSGFCGSIMCRYYTVRYFSLVNELICIVKPCDGVLIYRAVELSRISSLSGYFCKFSIPTGEGIGVLSRCRFSRNGLAIICRCCTIVPLAVLQLGAIVVIEYNGVLVHYAVELSRISSLSGYYCKFGIPTGEGIGVLCRCRFSRSRFAIICRCCAIVPLAVLQLGAIVVVEYNDVLVHYAVELSLVSSFACYLSQCRCPTCKAVGILSSSSLARVSVTRCCSVRYHSGVNDALVIVEPSDGIFVNRCIELCRIGSSLGYRHYLRTPRIIERIGILRRCSLGRSISGICRSTTVSHVFGLQRCVITIFPSDGVLIHRAAELSRVCSRTCYRHYLRIPTVEGIGVLIRCILKRSCTGVCRCLAILNVTALQYSSILILEGDGVLVHRSIELCGIGCISRNGCYLWSP